MGEGKTLWEIARKHFQAEKVAEQKEAEKPPEFKLFNPLQARIGDFITVGVPDLMGTRFQLYELDEYRRRIGEKDFVFTEYTLRREERRVGLRVIPLAEPEAITSKHYQVLLLEQDGDPMPYDETFHKEILPNTNGLEVRDKEGQLLATYAHLGGFTGPVVARVKVMRNPAESAGEEVFSLWDYVRKLDLGTDEFYFVEMNGQVFPEGGTEGTGEFTMYKGVEISEKDVEIWPVSN